LLIKIDRFLPHSAAQSAVMRLYVV